MNGGSVTWQERRTMAANAASLSDSAVLDEFYFAAGFFVAEEAEPSTDLWFALLAKEAFTRRLIREVQR